MYGKCSDGEVHRHIHPAGKDWYLFWELSGPCAKRKVWVVFLGKTRAGYDLRNSQTQIILEEDGILSRAARKIGVRCGRDTIRQIKML
jgi:hypothetical protein